MQIATNVDIEFDFDEDDLDIEGKVVVILEEQLESYIEAAGKDALCGLGLQLKQAIRLTVRDMFADSNV